MDRQLVIGGSVLTKQQIFRKHTVTVGESIAKDGRLPSVAKLS